MSLDISNKVLLVIILTDFSGIFIWIGICLYLAYTKMDLILEHLQNSPAITIRAPLRHGGPWGKLLLIGGISGIVTFPGFHLKRNQLSTQDLANFPIELRRKLVYLHWGAIGLSVIMVTFGIAVMLDLI